MRFLVVTAIVLACRFAHADVIAIEFGPEAPGAVDSGATAIKDALKLAKDPANKWKALFAFHKIATDWPAALHDCYVALAELRVDNVTEAKAFWDRAVVRGGTRPKWCTGDLSNQLAKALRDGKFVEITIAVTPADADVTWNGTIRVRGARSIWVSPANDTPFSIAAPNFQSMGVRVALTPSGGRLAVDLQPEVKPVAAPPDAGSDVVPPHVSDAGVRPAPVAPVVIQPPPSEPEDPEDRPHHHRLSFRNIMLGAGAASAAGAVIGMYMTHYESDKGNTLYRSDPTFQESKDLYTEFLGAAIVFSALSAACFVTALAVPGHDDKPTLSIKQPPGARGAMLELSGTFGAAR